MTPDEIIGKTLAVVFAMEEDELEWQIVRGTVRQNEGKWSLERDDENPYTLSAAWLPRIKPVEEDEIFAVVQTELWLIVTIGSLPQK